MKAIFVLFSCLFGLILTHETYLGNSRHPDHPGKCYHNATGKVLELSEISRPIQKDACQKFTCWEEYLIRIDSCQKYNVPSDCVEIPNDYSKPYPDCCVQLRCTVNGKEEIRKTAWDVDD